MPGRRPSASRQKAVAGFPCFRPISPTPWASRWSILTVCCRALKKSGLASLRDGDLSIEDWDRLVGLAEFDPDCFRPQHDPAELAATRGRHTLPALTAAQQA